MYKRARGLRKYLGLMFRTSKTQPLLFEFEKDVDIKVHSWFVFFDFKIIWFDKRDRCIETKIVKPFSVVRCSKPFRKFVEIPL